MTSRRRVLILCTGNSCRSQMAEAWIRHLLGESWDVRSAGTHPAAEVHELAVQAMSEVEVDLSAARPELVDAYLGDPWDLVVTVCDSAKETCPVFLRPVETLHISFPDPADAVGTEEEKLTVFRSVRDQIRESLLPEIARRS